MEGLLSMIERTRKILKSSITTLLAILVALTSVASGAVSSVFADESQITNIKVSGESAKGNEAKYAIDGDKSTFYLTPDETTSKDHYRYIDLELDGLYELSEIKIFNKVGTYNMYQIYVSEDGERFDKVAYKNNENIATENGDTHSISSKASFVRINVSYSSDTFQGNLVEVELYGEKIGETQEADHIIQVSDYKGSKWETEHLKFVGDTSYANTKTINEMKALVGRVIGNEWIDSFVFEIREANADGHDVFEIENGDNGTIIIRGNNGVALASGFNHYLRFYCNVNYTPLFASNLNMPSELPSVEGKIVKETEFDIRYALNFCTYSYTMAFWGWNEFEQFLDWAAMSGINSVLDIVGQEEVLRRTLSEFGYTDEEIKEYIVGPGYFAWFYMQNMTSFGGKLPNDWFAERVELGRQMHDRMEAFGITPMLNM